MASPRHWLEENFESDHVRATLGAWGMHLDFAPDVAGGALFPYLEAMANQAFGMVLGKNGANTIIKAMVKRLIEARGGSSPPAMPRWRASCMTQGKATGVELRDRRTFSARKAVIANVAPAALLELTGGSHDDDAQRGHAAICPCAGHDDDPSGHGGPAGLAGRPGAAKRFAYVHLAPSLDQMTRTYQQARAGLLPDEPVVVVGQPTAVDPSRAPEGKHVLWLQARMVPG